MAVESRREQVGLAVSLGSMALLVVLDIALGGRVALSTSYGIAAVIAAVLLSVRQTVAIAATAVGLAGVAGLWNDNFGTADWVVRLGLAAALGAIAVLAAAMRVRREEALVRMTVIAETAQRAVLRAMPSAVDSVGFAARYVSATEEALIGGDLYEVVTTPYGVRVVVGDVRGKGLDAVQMAATVLGEFRRTAYREQSLATLADQLDVVVRELAGEEDFVTCLLAEFHDDHTVTLVNCGHHPPMLVTVDGAVHQPAPWDPSRRWDWDRGPSPPAHHGRPGPGCCSTQTG